MKTSTFVCCQMPWPSTRRHLVRTRRGSPRTRCRYGIVFVERGVKRGETNPGLARQRRRRVCTFSTTRRNEFEIPFGMVWRELGERENSPDFGSRQQFWSAYRNGRGICLELKTKRRWYVESINRIVVCKLSRKKNDVRLATILLYIISNVCYCVFVKPSRTP